MILGPDSAARFTSPNAVSALRRLGVNATVPGHSLTELLAGADAVRRPVEEGS